jgi:hypothetical protein
LTVAEVLSTAGAPAVAAAAPAAAAPVVSTASAPVATTLAANDAGTHDLAPAIVETHDSALTDAVHHFHHMWG